MSTEAHDSGPHASPQLRQLGLDDISRFGIDAHNRLYWANEPIVTNAKLFLTRGQKLFGILIACVGLLAGVGEFVHGWIAFNELACRMEWRLSVCSPDMHGAVLRN